MSTIKLYLLDGERRIEMSPLESGSVDLETFNTIASHRRRDQSLTILCVAETFNPRHLNVRLSTPGDRPVHTVLTEYSTQISPSEYRITFTDIRVKDGVLLQTFYRNRWYALFLGDPRQETYRQRFKGSPGANKPSGREVIDFKNLPKPSENP